MDSLETPLRNPAILDNGCLSRCKIQTEFAPPSSVHFGIFSEFAQSEVQAIQIFSLQTHFAHLVPSRVSISLWKS